MLYIALLLTICPHAFAIPRDIESAFTRRDYLSRCGGSTFKPPELVGAEILAITAYPLYNFSTFDPGSQNITILPPQCSVNVTYTHTGWNDTITIRHFLPLEGWNGRFLGLGGGSYVGTVPEAEGVYFGQGVWAAAGTDAGHGYNGTNGNTPAEWALTASGNVNYLKLVDFGSKAFGDMPKIAKQIIADFYGQPPRYSYFTGCSGGGRQAMISAERYPNDYDGILAMAPAINWSRFFPSLIYAQTVMVEEEYFPSECEFAAFSAGVVEACDGIDGVMDGIVGDPFHCSFDPYSLVGMALNCSDAPSTITNKSANVIAKIWTGPEDADGSFIWYPYIKGYDMSVTANSTQQSNGSRVGAPLQLGQTWYQYFLTKNPSFDTESMNYSTFADLARQGAQEYASIIDMSDPDLRRFKQAGGKLISWHGLLDQYIPTNGTIEFYERAKSLDPDVEDFYRLYLAPGVAHCMPQLPSMQGYFPEEAMSSLMAWVEKDEAPATLLGMEFSTGREQPLCVYPKVAKWDGVNNASLASSYSCADHY